MRQLEQLLELGLREVPRDGAVLLLRVQRGLPQTGVSAHTRLRFGRKHNVERKSEIPQKCKKEE